MGKIDDMRRLREQSFDAAEKQHTKEAAPPTSQPDAEAPRPARPPVPPRIAADPKKAAERDNTDEAGRCSSCGKMKPMSNGVIAQHQKGLGKACPGSRKPPA